MLILPFAAYPETESFRLCLSRRAESNSSETVLPPEKEATEVRWNRIGLPCGFPLHGHFRSLRQNV